MYMLFKPVVWFFNCVFDVTIIKLTPKLNVQLNRMFCVVYLLSSIAVLVKTPLCFQEFNNLIRIKLAAQFSSNYP